MTVFVLLLLMMVSWIVSRGVLSTCVILFLVVAIVSFGVKKTWTNFWYHPYLPAFTLLFFIPFLSGLWSENLGKWLDVLRLKLPLLFFPLAFAANWSLSRRQWQWTAVIFLALIFSGCVWSLVHYSLHLQEVNEGYLRAKTLLTPLEDDHVRFSWLVSVAVISCLFFQHLFSHQRIKRALLVLALFFAVYLHILSARTGLFSFYLFLFLYAGWLLQKQKQKMIWPLLLCFSLPLLAYWFVPTFQNRIRYVVYDFSFVQKAAYQPGTSDGARVMSLKAGWQVLRQNPWGVGAGDVMHEADKWYAANVPQVLSTDKFYPSSEWLIYGVAAGWPGVVLFTLLMAAPFFFAPHKHRLYWYGFHLTAACSFLFDMGLEVQYGIFLYALITFWWWKMMQSTAIDDRGQP